MGTALITGASAGLGAEFAWQLAGRGHDLVLVARSVERLNVLADQINGVCGVNIEVLPADLSDRAQVDVVAKRIESKPEGRRVQLLINNAGSGLGLDTSLIGSDLEAQENALDLMVRAVLVLSHSATQAMVAHGRGAILNVSSIAALLTSGTYAAAKAWVKTFTESLAADLAGTGVTATVLCPGLVHTEFHDRAHIDHSVYPEFMWLEPENVVATALADVGRGAVISTPSVKYLVASQVAQYAPRSVIRLLTGPQRGMSAQKRPTSI